MITNNEKKISYYGVIGIILTTVIGSGIWRDPIKWSVRSGLFGIFAIIFVWFLFLCMGLAYSECVAMFPKSGGPYSFVSASFGEKFGIYTGILYYIAYIFFTSLLAFISVIFSFPNQSIEVQAILTVILLISLGFLVGFSKPYNIGRIAFLFSFLKISLILGVALLAFLNWNTTTTEVFTIPTLNNFSETVNLVIWSLLGFEIALIFAGETENVRKNIPKAIIVSLILILIIYLTFYLACVGLFGLESNIDDSQPFIAIGQAINLESSSIAFIASFSAIGTCYGALSVLTHQSRVLARDKVFSASFNKTIKGYYFYNAFFGVTLSSLTALTMIIFSTFWADSVNNFASTGVTFVLLASALPAGFVALYLRIKLPALERPFKSPIYFLVFPATIILSIYLLILNVSDIATYWPTIVFVLLILIVLYLIIVLTNIFQKKEKMDTWNSSNSK